jgi:hypothetical protein
VGSVLEFVRPTNIRVAVLDAAFLSVPNRENAVTLWRVGFMGGEISTINVLVSVAQLEWFEVLHGSQKLSQ